MRKITIERKITCINPIECSEKIELKIKNKHNLILRPQTQNGIHNGYMEITHRQGNHLIEVFLYESDKSLQFVKKPLKFITEQQLRDLVI